jgi:hypothetical protein
VPIYSPLVIQALKESFVIESRYITNELEGVTSQMMDFKTDDKIKISIPLDDDIPYMTLEEAKLRDKERKEYKEQKQKEFDAMKAKSDRIRDLVCDQDLSEIPMLPPAAVPKKTIGNIIAEADPFLDYDDAKGATIHKPIASEPMDQLDSAWSEAAPTPENFVYTTPPSIPSLDQTSLNIQKFGACGIALTEEELKTAAEALKSLSSNTIHKPGINDDTITI